MPTLNANELTAGPGSVAQCDEIHDVVLHLQDGRVATVNDSDAGRSTGPVLG